MAVDWWVWAGLAFVAVGFILFVVSIAIVAAIPLMRAAMLITLLWGLLITWAMGTAQRLAVARGVSA